MASNNKQKRTNNHPSNLTDEGIESIRKESSMLHPIEPGKKICDDCLNRIGGGCDYVDMGDMTVSELLERMATSTCDLYIKKRS